VCSQRNVLSRIAVGAADPILEIMCSKVLNFRSPGVRGGPVPVPSMSPSLCRSLLPLVLRDPQDPEMEAEIEAEDLDP
jgi:hypothetical protein